MIKILLKGGPWKIENLFYFNYGKPDEATKYLVVYLQEIYGLPGDSCAVPEGAALAERYQDLD